MADNYQVILSDLQDMAKRFDDESQHYQAIQRKVAHPPADTGEGSLNQTLDAVLSTLQVLHANMQAQIEDHAKTIRDTKDSYQRHDLDNRELFEDLVPKTWGW